MLNGDGLRVVLWVSGCSHHCKGCQNPITWDKDEGLVFDEAAKQELFEELEKEYIDGITFSGGDPLFPGNANEIGELINEVHDRFPTKTIWLYTGFEWKDINDLPFMSFVDVIVDGQYVEEQRDTSLQWKGSSNQNVIDVKDSLRIGRMVLHCSR